MFENLNTWYQEPLKIHSEVNRKMLIKALINQTFSQSNHMFVYEGLPDNVPSWFLEYSLQTRGHCIFTKIKEKFWVIFGNLGGVPNGYYIPQEYLAPNPYIPNEKQYSYKIGTDCILCKNDVLMTGLLPVVNYKTILIADSFITLQKQLLNRRIPNPLIAEENSDKENWITYLKEVAEGKPTAFVSDSIIEKIGKSFTIDNRDNTDLRETTDTIQYLRGSLYHDIGLNSNYNMKREVILSSESELNKDALKPLIDEMLEQREIMCKDINTLYSLNISVKKGGVWADIELSERSENIEEPEENKISKDEKEIEQDE